MSIKFFVKRLNIIFLGFIVLSPLQHAQTYNRLLGYSELEESLLHSCLPFSAPGAKPHLKGKERNREGSSFSELVIYNRIMKYVDFQDLSILC